MIDYFSWRYFFLLAPLFWRHVGVGEYETGRTDRPTSERRHRSLGGAVCAHQHVGFHLRPAQQAVGESMRILLIATFVLSLIGFLVHESRAKTPFVNLQLFKIRRFSFSVISLLIVAMCYSLTGFLLPFYLQDILHLSPTRIGLLFMAPSVLTVALAPLSGYLADRLGPRIPATVGVVFMIVSLGIGGLLRVDCTGWMPARYCRRRHHQRRIQSRQLDGDDRHDAEGASRLRFGDQSRDLRFWQCFGVALGGLSMSLAFEHFTGVKAMALTTGDAAGFVAALNLTFVAAIVLTLAAIVTSAARRREAGVADAIPNSKFQNCRLSIERPTDFGL
jgi:hypothetical protein